MLEKSILNLCRDNPELRDLKIRNIEHAINEAEEIIKESNMREEELIYLKRKISESLQDLEILYLMKK